MYYWERDCLLCSWIATATISLQSLNWQEKSPTSDINNPHVKQCTLSCTMKRLHTKIVQCRRNTDGTLFPEIQHITESAERITQIPCCFRKDFHVHLYWENTPDLLLRPHLPSLFLLLQLHFKSRIPNRCQIKTDTPNIRSFTSMPR